MRRHCTTDTWAATPMACVRTPDATQNVRHHRVCIASDGAPGSRRGATLLRTAARCGNCMFSRYRNKHHRRMSNAVCRMRSGNRLSATVKQKFMSCEVQRTSESRTHIAKATTGDPSLAPSTTTIDTSRAPTASRKLLKHQYSN